MAKRLFHEHTVEGAFRERRDQAARAVAKLREINDIDQAVASVLKDHQITMAKIHRQSATLPHRTTSDGVIVTLTVPFTGDGETFWLIPPRHNWEDVIEGSVYSRHPWGNEAEGPRVEFEKAFPAPTQDDVKAWGKRTVDAVELRLAALEPAVTEQNRMLRDLIRVHVERRKQTLDASGELGDLGTGI